MRHGAELDGGGAEGTGSQPMEWMKTTEVLSRRTLVVMRTSEISGPR
jgi:hypothetical protein